MRYTAVTNNVLYHRNTVKIDYKVSISNSKHIYFRIAPVFSVKMKITNLYNSFTVIYFIVIHS
jgi:hypothetical protein